MAMAGSITHDILKGPPPPPIDRGWGGGGDGSEGRGSSRRASFTGLYVLLAASIMVFAAFTSAFVVLASSVFLDLSRRALKNRDRSKFNLWWSVATALGILFLVGQAWAWRE